MNITSEKTRGGRRIVIMLMLAAFSLALFATPVLALSSDPNTPPLDRPWTLNSDGGDDGGWGTEQSVAKKDSWSFADMFWQSQLFVVPLLGIYVTFLSDGKMKESKNPRTERLIMEADNEVKAPSH